MVAGTATCVADEAVLVPGALVSLAFVMDAGIKLSLGRHAQAYRESRSEAMATKHRCTECRLTAYEFSGDTLLS